VIALAERVVDPDGATTDRPHFYVDEARAFTLHPIV
jgi:hypothetical protein